jgi:spore germination cell wall hydrolase CwlJ-like protein
VRSDRLRLHAARATFFSIVAALTIAVAGFWIERADERRAARRAEDLLCLAENIYHEARGEPLVGQYAVAEVTMNRVRSREFPDSVCAVVHQRGAFSWTYRSNPPAPSGYEWLRAQAIAGSIYDNNEAPLVAGALYYHATYVTPGWAVTRTQVTRIGRHLFYL